MEQRQLAITADATAADAFAIITTSLIIVPTSVPDQHWYNANWMEYGIFFFHSLLSKFTFTFDTSPKFTMNVQKFC